MQAAKNKGSVILLCSKGILDHQPLLREGPKKSIAHIVKPFKNRKKKKSNNTYSSFFKSLYIDE